MTKITIREGTNGVIQDGTKPHLREVDAIVHGDYATYYHPLLDMHSVTHIPTGYAVCFVLSEPEALTIIAAIKDIRISATYDDEHGLKWPDKDQEAPALTKKIHELGIQPYRPAVSS